MKVMWQSTLQQQFSHIADLPYADNDSLSEEKREGREGEEGERFEYIADSQLRLYTRTVWFAFGKLTVSPRRHPSERT